MSNSVDKISTWELIDTVNTTCGSPGKEWVEKTETYRMPIQGGWSTLIKVIHPAGYTERVTSHFVPDEDHKWEEWKTNG